METETKGKVVQIYSHFMARVAKFDELADAGNTFLVSFRQALEFIRRPSIEKTSELFEKVIKANNTHRMQSYVKAGYAHTSIRAENLNKSKDIIDELACLVEEVRLALEAASETLQDDNHDMDPVSPTSSEEETVSFVPKKPEDIDYATMVAVVYTMVKQDYVMQEKIVSALNLKTSSGELESYCLMWSLRPFGDMRIGCRWELGVKAWESVYIVRCCSRDVLGHAVYTLSVREEGKCRASGVLRSREVELDAGGIVCVDVRFARRALCRFVQSLELSTIKTRLRINNEVRLAAIVVIDVLELDILESQLLYILEIVATAS
ncbi:hypothetical protein Tco_1140649 [Tanacetum coccineum]